MSAETCERRLQPFTTRTQADRLRYERGVEIDSRRSARDPFVNLCSHLDSFRRRVGRGLASARGRDRRRQRQDSAARVLLAESQPLAGAALAAEHRAPRVVDAADERGELHQRGRPFQRGQPGAALEDPRLVETLRQRGITLDLCPTSNMQSGTVPDLASHPVTRLHREGVSVTVSTDDRTVSQTDLSSELAAVALATDMTPDELAGWVEARGEPPYRTGQVLAGVCWYIMEPAKMAAAFGWRNVLTNSAKVANIIGGYRLHPILRRTEVCIEEAVTGRLPAGARTA